MKVNKKKSHIISTLPAGFLGMSKTVMLGFVLVCLIVAGVVIYKSGSGGSSRSLDVYEGKEMWVKCVNPDCGAEHQIDAKEYYEFQKEHTLESLRLMGPVPMTCTECAEESVYRAIKCPNCGNVFIRGILEGEPPDKCPECGQSEMQEKSRSRKQGS